MKFLSRFLASFLIAVLLVPVSAFSAGLDYDKMTEEELQAVIDQARIAMTKFHPLVEEGTILYSDKNISVTYTGNCSIDMFGTLIIEIIITNSTDKNIRVCLEDESCNGWAVNTIISGSVPAGKKAKSQFKVSDIENAAGVTSVEDVKEIEASIYYFDEATYDNMIKRQHVLWQFNQ